MRKTFAVSGVAISALILAIAPAGAVSLNLGGGGSAVSVSPSSNSGSGSSSSGGVTVDLGGDGEGGLLGLGGSDDSGLDVNLGTVLGDDDGNVLGNDGLVDLDTDSGNDGVIVDLFGSEGAVADVDLGLEGEGENGLLAGDDLIDLDLDGEGDAVVLLDLFGPGGSSDVADATIGLDGVTGEEELVDLNGEGDAAVNADLFGRSGRTGGAGQVADVDLGLGGSDDALLDLGGSAGNVAVDLFGDDPNGSSTGSTPPSGGTASNGGSGGSGGSAATPGNPGAMQPMPRPIPARPGAVRVATETTGSAGCFSPDQGQIAHLLGRTAYSTSIAAEWRSADDIRLVPINLCADARGQLEAALAADANIGTLHSAIAVDTKITGALAPSYDANDVLAIDQSGEDLTVYVY